MVRFAFLNFVNVFIKRKMLLFKYDFTYINVLVFLNTRQNEVNIPPLDFIFLSLLFKYSYISIVYLNYVICVICDYYNFYIA